MQTYALPAAAQGVVIFISLWWFGNDNVEVVDGDVEERPTRRIYLAALFLPYVMRLISVMHAYGDGVGTLITVDVLGWLLV